MADEELLRTKGTEPLREAPSESPTVSDLQRDTGGKVNGRMSVKTKFQTVGGHPTLGLLVARYDSGRITYPRGYNHAPAITCPGLIYIEFSIDGKLIGGLREDGYVHVWDVQTGKELWKTKAQHFSPSEFGQLIVGSEDELVAIINKDFSVAEKFNITTGAVMA